MKTIVSRLIIALCLVPAIALVAKAQQATSALTSYSERMNPHGSLNADDPLFPSTGRAYWGFDLGLTESWYLGGNHFFWPVQDAANDISTPLQFNNLGSGVGGIFGIKAAIPLSNSIDLEGKLRYLSNYTTATESDNLFNSTTQGQTTVPSTYSMFLANLDIAAILHFALSEQWYAAAGLSFSGLLGNTFFAQQTLPAGVVYDNSLGQPTGVTQETVPSGSQSNLFSTGRGDLQLGAGAVFPLSSIALDAELLFSVPLTPWLQSGEQDRLNTFADAYNASVEGQGSTAILSHPTIPNLWYASLTIGIRFPFKSAEEEPMAYSSSEVPGESNQGVGSDGKVALTGTVRNAKTGQPVDATMTVVDLTNNEVVATDRTHDGKYNVRVKAPGKYSVTADADGYLFGTAYFQVDPQGRILARDQDIKLSETSGGRTRLLVFFDFNSSTLKSSSYPELDRAVRLMKAVPNMKVQIAGYTDSIGSDEYNQQLSQRRAEAVRNYLVQNGIAANRVSAHGYGKESPIADNGTEEGRSENRRVEFVVLSD